MPHSTKGSFNAARPIDTWVGLLICLVLFAWARLRQRFGGPRLPPMRATTPPAPDQQPPPARRILCIKFYGLGNIVMLLPALSTLRRAYPQAAIDFLTLSENCALLERGGIVSRTIGVTASEPLAFLRSFVRMLREVRRARYDLVLDFEQFIKLSAIIAFWSGAPRRVGFNTDGQRRAWLYTTRVVYVDGEHMSRIFLRILRGIGIHSEPVPVKLAADPAEGERVDAILREVGVPESATQRIVVHPGSGPNFYRVPLKRWPAEHFARLCDALIERHGAAVVLTGKGEEERGLVAGVRAAMRQHAFDLCDRLSVPGMIALIERSSLVVVNDTSVMHLASAVGTPVVAFFGPTAPVQYGPGDGEHLVFYRDLYCSPCITNYNLKVSRCTDPVCIRTIGVEEALAAIERRFFAGPAVSGQAGRAERVESPSPRVIAN